LIAFQSIPAKFIIPQYPLLSSKLDLFMPVLQERSKQETNLYCILVIIIITKACTTGGGELEQYLITCQIIPAKFIIPQYPLLLSSKLDPYKPVLKERSKQETKSYCKLVLIVITKAHARGGGVRTIFDYYKKEVNKKQNYIVVDLCFY
jgi:hypothetical protein